ncbi:PHD finger protein EHD3-like isoform X2 [Carex rostrata]
MGGGGIENCICAALGTGPFTLFGRPQENGYATEASAATEFTLNRCIKAYVGDNTSKCQNTLVEVLVSEKFVMLCDILFRNFRVKDYRRYIDLTKIHYRMKNNLYEKSPHLFLRDILQLWREFEKVGRDIVRLTSIFSDRCRVSFQKQVGVEFELEACEENAEDNCILNTETCVMDLTAPNNNINDFSIVYNNMNNNNSGDSCTTIQQLTLTHSDRSSHPDPTDRTCKTCGCNALNSQFLICDGCECAYHMNCIRPAVKVIPTQYWYCKSCTGTSKKKKTPKKKKKATGPHEHCVACKKRLENTEFTETPLVLVEPRREGPMSNVKESDDLGPQELCKLCGLKEEDDKIFLKCGHAYCLYKNYHVRCLKETQIASEQQLNRPCWYCPSCLCRGCYADVDDENIVLCDGCDEAYHIYCMKPPRDSVPKGEWYCVACNLGRARKAMRIHQEALVLKYQTKQG